MQLHGGGRMEEKRRRHSYALHKDEWNKECMRHVVNEMRSIEVHSTNVKWKLCTAQGTGQA